MYISRIATLGAIAFVSVLAAIGCDEPESSGGGDNLEDFPMAYGSTHCYYLFHCCPEEQLAHIREAPLSLLGETESECAAMVAGFTTVALPGLQESQSAGRLRYDANAMKGCLESLKTSCSPEAGSCDAALVPLVKIGGACTTNAECIEGGCLKAWDETEGKCTALLKNGEDCEDDDECLSDYCDYDSGTCAPAAEKLAAIDEDCVSDSDCVSNYCDSESSLCAESPYANSCKL